MSCRSVRHNCQVRASQKAPRFAARAGIAAPTGILVRLPYSCSPSADADTLPLAFGIAPWLAAWTSGMPATARSSALDPARLLRELTAAHLLTAEQAPTILSEFQSAGAGEGGGAFVDFLVDAGLLTPFQAERARLGDAAKLALGPYSLLEPVGSGSLGVVYRAIRRDTRKRFAVKVLPLRSLWNVLQAKKQVTEFAALPAHPAVVPFVDIDTANGSHYLVWPFVEGETFDALVRRTGPLDPAKAADYLADVADALALCHSHNLAHGLLKPSNLMLGPDRRPRILDLGMGAILAENLADNESLLDTISTANTTRGSLECSAPETLTDPSIRTPTADAYAFGCILYYVLTGVYPFADVSAVDQIIAHQTQEPVPAQVRNPDIPESLARLVVQLMKKAPAERPQNLELVRDALRIEVDAAPITSVRAPDPATPKTVLPARDATVESVNFNMPEEIDVDAADARSLVLLARAKSTAETPRPNVTNAPVAPIVLQPRPAGRTEGHRQRKKKRNDLDLPPTPVNWSQPVECGRLAFVDVPPPPRSLAMSLWRAIHLVFGWVAARDVVQLTVFGPRSFAPGQTTGLLIYAHPPTAFNSVRTLSRAFLPDTELLATGYTAQLIPRGRPLALHLAVANAGVAKPLVTFSWEGQTRPSTFDVYVPWESPAGKAPALISAGVDNIEAARLPFEVTILPRTG